MTVRLCSNQQTWGTEPGGGFADGMCLCLRSSDHHLPRRALLSQDPGQGARLGMEEIFYNDGLKIDICRLWKYFEVFGLSDDEFKELEKFYHYQIGR